MILKHLMIAVTLVSGFAALPAAADAQPRHGWNGHHRQVRVCKRVRDRHHRWVRRCTWRRR
ncbi:hypothetical protein [Sphingomonas quercus]|uniref:Uncharacterized protein n=1 Tax=Sphingomonas quercus TaxID=2842451 RepID=A0ABS6BHF8_9SPHN|nr:hypothetical protein [Sphingomonas quercus]MBU3076896.1 hypothetical protein [Sphingomonas quercus]